MPLPALVLQTVWLMQNTTTYFTLTRLERVNKMFSVHSHSPLCRRFESGDQCWHLSENVTLWASFLGKWKWLSPIFGRINFPLANPVFLDTQCLLATTGCSTLSKLVLDPGASSLMGGRKAPSPPASWQISRNWYCKVLLETDALRSDCPGSNLGQSAKGWGLPSTPPIT